MRNWKEDISLPGWGAGDSFCPYLGASHDPETHFAYSSTENYCHVVQPPVEVRLAYQEECCLTVQFLECPVYQHRLDTLPVQARLEDLARLPARRRRIRPYWFLLLLIVVVLVGLWYSRLLPFGISGWAVSPDPSATLITQVTASELLLQATSTAPATITPAPTQTETMVPSPSATLQPSATNTLPPTPGPGLGTPFGDQTLYVLHRVKEGQTYGFLANLYATTEDVIRAANVLPAGKSLWPGDYLIIPVGENDPARVSAFTWFYTERRISLEELADQFSVTVEEIKLYNNLGELDWIPVGRWLILSVHGQ